jgi:trimeric autotransporter adhesin
VSVSLRNNSTGELNSAIVEGSLFENTTGNYNTGIGLASLATNTTGSNNTALGAEADVLLPDFTNATAIGFHAIVDASNKVRIGNSAVTVIEGQVPFTTPSDGRFKFNVNEDVKGLPFIMQLRPVTYQFDVKRFDGKSGENATMQAAYTEAENIRRTGFIAQEVEKAAVNTGYDFSGVIKPKKEGDHYSLSYDAFVVPLVKGMQEQQKVIETQQNKIQQQDQKIVSLEKEIGEIKKLLQEIKNGQK